MISRRYMSLQTIEQAQAATARTADEELSEAEEETRLIESLAA